VENDTNNLVTYRNGKLEVLISNFEIKGQVEFNGNLLLHGYDRRQKKTVFTDLTAKYLSDCR